MIVPTTRAVLLLVAAAPLALVIAAVVPAAWIAAPALCLTLVALVLADAALAGSMRELRLVAPAQVEVGAAQALAVHARFAGGRRSAVSAALAADPRLVPGGRAALPLLADDDADDDGDGVSGRFAFVPDRRGIAAIERTWLRWHGPLGLGARQVSRTDGAQVRIVPNVAALRSPTIQTYLRDAQFGMVARRLRGEGTEFEALAEYRPGMDRRSIDWKSSARHSRLFAKEFETERNSQIVLAFDCGRAMCEPIGGEADGAGTGAGMGAGTGDVSEGTSGGVPRIDRAVSAGLTTAYIALRGGDRVALFGFAARPELATEFVSGTRAFHRLQAAAATLDYRAQEPNFTLALATLAGRLQRRSLVIVFSDFTDPTSAQLMIESIGRLVSRHLVLFVTLADAELDGLARQTPGDMQALAMAVTADALLRQRALATSRLRALGVDVIEAPWDRIGPRLIDAYLKIKRTGAIG